jgi:transcriptional regulator with XRE-family HTH domain
MGVDRDDVRSQQRKDEADEADEATLAEIAAVLSANLKRSRTAAAKTEAEVAARMGITREEYEAIEAGDVDAVADVLTVEQLGRAVDAIGTTYRDLVTPLD